MVWARVIIHCLATLDLVAGFEQPFDFLVIQNSQAMRSTGRSMDWTLEVQHAQQLVFCATLTGRRRDIPHLSKQERKHRTPLWARLSRTHAVLVNVIPGWWMPGMKVRSLVVFSNHSAFHQWSTQTVFFAEIFWSFFAEIFWSLKHLSHHRITTRRSSGH